jgi:hypothetical protein
MRCSGDGRGEDYHHGQGIWGASPPQKNDLGTSALNSINLSILSRAKSNEHVFGKIGIVYATPWPFFKFYHTVNSSSFFITR